MSNELGSAIQADNTMINASSFLSRFGVTEAPLVEKASGIALERENPDVVDVDAAPQMSETSNSPEASEATATDETGSSVPTEASKTEAKTETTPTDASQKEMVQITDSKGRKTQLEIDFSNKDAIKKVYQDSSNFQNGFRKMQVERDQLKSQLDKHLNEVEPIRANFKMLDEAYQKSGVEGVVDLLESKSGGYKSWIDKQIERAEFRRNASPDELRALEQSDLANKYQREAEERTKEFADFKKSVEAERAVSEQAKLQSEVTPLFEKYRFAGKLGDEADEALFDKMLWKTAMDNLAEEYPEGNVKPEAVEDEFRVVSATLRKRIQNQVEKTATKVVERQKQNALEKVQTQVKSEYTTPADKDRLQRDKFLAEGDIGGLLKGWKKFSSISR